MDSDLASLYKGFCFKPRCICKAGFLRDDKRRCIPATECPEVDLMELKRNITATMNNVWAEYYRRRDNPGKEIIELVKRINWMKTATSPPLKDSADDSTDVERNSTAPHS
uniref:TIL domain-containing protein n=1 Tax=Steinernema glaseri TaxID=37863 RepID=A0A1I7Y775_9BILA